MGFVVGEVAMAEPSSLVAVGASLPATVDEGPDPSVSSATEEAVKPLAKGEPSVVSRAPAWPCRIAVTLARLSVLSLAGGAVKPDEEVAEGGAEASASAPEMTLGLVAPPLIPSPNTVWGRGGAKSEVWAGLRSEPAVAPPTASNPPADPSAAENVSEHNHSED